MKKKQPRLRRSLDADNDIRFNQEEIRRLLKKREAEAPASVTLVPAQALPKQSLPYEVKSVKPRIGFDRSLDVSKENQGMVVLAEPE